MAGLRKQITMKDMTRVNQQLESIKDSMDGSARKIDMNKSIGPEDFIQN